MGYSVGNILVSYGGADLAFSDYTATDGTSVVLADGAVAGKIIRVVAFQAFEVAGSYTKVQSDNLLANKAPIASPSFTGNVDIAGTVTADGVAAGATATTGYDLTIGAFTSLPTVGWNYIDYPSGSGLQIRNGTAPAFAINGGNIGIGTTSPSSKFVVAEGTNQHGIELVPGSVSYIQAYDRATSDYGDLKIDAERIMFGTDNGAERVRISSSGKVGINTTSPSQAKLEVLAESDYSSHTGHGISIVSNANDVYTGMYMGTDDTIDAAYIQSAGINFSFESKKLLLNPNGGNIGIGTNSALATLSIKGTTNELDIETSAAGVSLESIDRASFSKQSDMSFYARYGNHIFYNGAYTERMRISSSGIVTTPYQPAFRARLSSDLLISSAPVNVIFSTKEADIGNNYNVTTGQFTAPVSGTYMVSWGGTVRMETVEAYATSYLLKNGVGAFLARNRGNNAAAGIRYTGGTVAMPLFLSSGDYINVQAYCIGSNTYLGGAEFQFGAYLIG